MSTIKEINHRNLRRLTGLELEKLVSGKSITPHFKHLVSLEIEQRKPKKR